MPTGQISDVIALTRLGIADRLADLDDAQLATPSLCHGWDVATVAAHLAVSVTVARPVLVASVIRHGGSMPRATDRLARRMARSSIARSIDVLRDNADRQLISPRNGPVAPLTELLVHAGDIARPLGLPYDPPADAVRKALDLLVNVRPLGLVTRGSLSGIQLVASDLDLTVGSGLEVRGTGADLMMAACGRGGVLSDLTGPGVDLLRSRLR